MHTHTPHIRPLTCVALLGTALLLLSCTKTEIRQQESGDGAITFTNVGTKAPVESPNEISSFSVWGWYADEAGTSGNVFDATQVSKDTDGSWTYDGLRYWQSGKTYDFYAVYPDVETLESASAAEDVSYSPDGNFTITGFDSTSGHDLMTASRTGMPGDNPQPVAFTFNHTLSAVRFVVKTDPNTLEANPGFEIRLLEASLYGLPVKGNYSIENFNEHWTYSDSDFSTQSMPFASMENENDVSGNIEFSLFGEDDSLVIPVSPLSSLSAVLEMSYRTRQGESSDWSETKYRTIELSSLSHGWSAGLRYRYTATIGDYLTFSVNVSAWNTSTGGIITVE